MSRPHNKQQLEKLDENIRILPRHRVQARNAPRRIAFVVYPDFEPLDLTGPFSVFAGTTRWLREVQKLDYDAYVIEVLGAEVGPLRADGGLGVVVDRSFLTVRGGIDTLLVVGGSGSRNIPRKSALFG
jgi:transcriptional regulator GlxA family with amidase domain